MCVCHRSFEVSMYLLPESNLGTQNKDSTFCYVLLGVGATPPVSCCLPQCELLSGSPEGQQAEFCSNFLCWVMAKEGVQLHGCKLCLVSWGY